MIFDAILLIFQGLIKVLLAPLAVVNIAVDFVSSIAIIRPFLQIVAYIIPFQSILPLIILSLTLMGIRITIAIITFILKFIPGMRWLERSFI